MPAVFKKIKVKAKTGRGEGTDGMLEDFIANQYDSAFEAFNGASAEDKQEVIDGLNSVQDDLGEAFSKGKDDFECAALDLLNHETFFKKLQELGFDIQL